MRQTAEVLHLERFRAGPLERPGSDALAVAEQIKLEHERRVPGVAFKVTVTEYADGFRIFNIRHA